MTSRSPPSSSTPPWTPRWRPAPPAPAWSAAASVAAPWCWSTPTAPMTSRGRSTIASRSRASPLRGPSRSCPPQVPGAWPDPHAPQKVPPVDALRLDASFVDYLLVIVYFAVVLLIGLAARRRVSDSLDFFLSGRS